MRFIEWASLQYHLLWAYDGPAPEVARVGTYTSEDTSCWLLRKGAVVLRTTGQAAVTVHPGQWVFVASPGRHQRFSPDAELLSLHFQLTWPGRVTVVNRERNLVISADKIPQLERAARPVVRLLARTFPGAGAFLPGMRCTREAYLRVQSLLPPLLNAYLDAQDTLGNLPAMQSGIDERVLRASAEIDRMPIDQTMSEARLDRQLGLSRSHLDALFVAQLETTPRRYLEGRRLTVAERLLKQTQRSVKEIAIELGFRHSSHFCMWFKRLRGRSPTEFRKG